MAGKYYMYENMKTPRDVTGYTLFRGTTDWSQLHQFDYYEKGFPYLILVSIPEFMEKMIQDGDKETKNMIESYKHVLEYEFKGFDSGLENITTDTLEINNGVQSMNVIGRTQLQASNFSMTYTERSGSVLTRTHELYLRSVRDPASSFKTYNGLIGFGANQMHPEEIGFDKECFSFLYMHTDSTGLLLERAAYIVGAQPTTAELSIYNAMKGDIQFAEVSCEFTGFPIYGRAINQKAKEILDWMNSEANANMVQRNSWDYNYAAITDSTSGLAQSSLTR